jgi:hypothetical protein
MTHRHRLRAALVALTLAVLAVGAPAPALADSPGGSISGTVHTPPGVDPGGIEVGLVRMSSPAGLLGPALTAPDGTYTVAGLADGNYVVSFNARSRGLAFQYWPYVDGFVSARLVSVAGGAVTGIDAHLYMGASLSGTLRTSSDCDLTKVRVVPTRHPSVDAQWAEVQPDGRWSVIALPSGPYTIEIDGRYAGLAEDIIWPSKDTTFPLASGESRTGIDVTLTGPAHGCVAPEVYTRQLYRDLLGREGGDEVFPWIRTLVAGASREQVANAVTSSDEFRTRLLDDTYRAYLGRGTDPSGLAFWLAEMRAGRPIEAVQAGFIASDEFYAASGGTPEGWVRGLYRTVLDREPSQPEVDWWVNAIGHGMNRGSVAGGFLYSTEHLTTVVDGYYQWLLRRHIDPVGARDWVARIQQGYRDEAIIAGIVASPEYATHIPR